MFTWISRATACTLTAFALAGCEEATGLPFAQELSALTEPAGREKLSEVRMARGTIIVAAPQGYCFDRRSLKRLGQRGFAVMARCDTLGVRGFFNAHDLAIITVTTAPQSPDTPALSLSALEATGNGAPVLSRENRDGLLLVRFGDGPQPFEGVSPTQWRGAFQVNGQLVGLGLYAPEGSDALTVGGASILADLTRRTRKASAAQAQLDASE